MTLDLRTLIIHRCLHVKYILLELNSLGTSIGNIFSLIWISHRMFIPLRYSEYIRKKRSDRFELYILGRLIVYIGNSRHPTGM
jgi:hypothetical protein